MGKPVMVRMTIDYNRVEKLFKDTYEKVRRIKSQSSPEKDVNYMNMLTEFMAQISLCSKAVTVKD